MDEAGWGPPPSPPFSAGGGGVSGLKDGITSVTLSFPPAGSHLLVLYPNETPLSITQTPLQVVSEIKLPGSWNLTLDGLNSLTLDTACLKLGSAAWSQPTYILDAQRIVMSKGAGTTFALRFNFDINTELPKPLYLVVESPARFEITVNGRNISTLDCGWWVDISFRKLDLGDTLHVGHNEITLAGSYRQDMELESIYLVGDFGVNARRIGLENRCTGQVFDRYSPNLYLETRPVSVTATPSINSVALDLTANGLPFYAGRARLSQILVVPAFEGHPYLEFTNLRAAVAVVWVNGKRMGACAWQPHQVDLGDSLVRGENQIENVVNIVLTIELVPTLRNLLGPHHRRGGDTEATGPSDFINKLAWTDDLILVPLGFDCVTLKYIK